MSTIRCGSIVLLIVVAQPRKHPHREGQEEALGVKRTDYETSFYQSKIKSVIPILLQLLFLFRCCSPRAHTNTHRCTYVCVCVSFSPVFQSR